MKTELLMIFNNKMKICYYKKELKNMKNHFSYLYMI